jgi:hypothetical protein
MNAVSGKVPIRERQHLEIWKFIAYPRRTLREIERVPGEIRLFCARFSAAI